MEGLRVKILKFEVPKEQLDYLESLPERLEEMWYAIVHKTCFDIQHNSQLKVPVDQGVAKASHYVVLKDGDDTFEEAISEAIEETHNESQWGHEHRKTDGLFFGSSLDQTDLNRVSSNSDYIWGFVCIAVVYGLELETGYVSGSLNVRAKNPGASRPFLTPSVIEYEQYFLEACRQAFGKI
jgi:hypothetical protein